MPAVIAEGTYDYDPAGIYAYPARVVPIERAGSPLSRDELLVLAQKRAPDPSVFDERPPFFWSAEISNNSLDAYYTFMDPATTLRNYEQDAIAGVSFQNSHDYRQLGFGQSLNGRFIGGQGNGLARTMADFYTIPGIRANMLSTDDFIAGARSGVWRDVSVGFYGGEFRCMICGRDMMTDWDCIHIPGYKYYPVDPEGKPIRDAEKIVSTAKVVDAHLAEVSIVYDGATPGAAIVKAYKEAGAGRMTDVQIGLFEQRHRIKLPAAKRLTPGATLAPPNGEEDPDMAKTPENDLTKDQRLSDVTIPVKIDTSELGQLTERISYSLNALHRAGAPQHLDLGGQVDWLVGEHQRLLPFQAEVAELRPLREQVSQLGRDAADVESARQQLDELKRLRPLAEEVLTLRPLAERAKAADRLEQENAKLSAEAADGRVYREDLIADTLKEGVRANGQGFEPAPYETMLRTPGMPLASIRQFRDDWRKLADSKHPAGRQTPEGSDPPDPSLDATDDILQPDKKPASGADRERIPNAAYAA